MGKYWVNINNSDMVKIITRRHFKMEGKKRIRFIKYKIINSEMDIDQPWYACPAKDWHKYFRESSVMEVLYDWG